MVFRNVGEIPAFGNQFKHFSCFFSNIQMLIVVFHIFCPSKSLSCRKIGLCAVRSVSWRRVDKIKLLVKADSNDKNTLTKLWHSVFGKVIQLDFYHVAVTDIRKIGNNLADCLSVIRSEQAFYIFRDKRTGLSCFNKTKIVFVKISSVAVKSWLLPNDRKILARKTTQNKVAGRN